MSESKRNIQFRILVGAAMLATISMSKPAYGAFDAIQAPEAVANPSCPQQIYAAISAITPNPATSYQTLTFSGMSISSTSTTCGSTTWEWTSNFDGVLSNSNVFNKSGNDLSVGKHKICFEASITCSNIQYSCLDCASLEVTQGSLTGVFCGIEGASWMAMEKAGTAHIFDESASSNLVITGTNGRDLILGNGLANKIKGRKGMDCIYGYDGKDDINGERGSDTIFGGADNDTIDGDIDNDKIYGEHGSDDLKGGSGTDTLDGGDGDDRIEGGAGNDTLTSGPGRNKLKGDSGNDTINGGNGDDFLMGDAGSDELIGADGNDRLCGNAGKDDLDGALGSDACRGGSNNDTKSGCEGSQATHSQCTISAWNSW